jgi:hypothetical protein
MRKLLMPGLLLAISLVASDCGKRAEAITNSSDTTDQLATPGDTSANKIKILQFEGYEVTLTPQEDVGEIVSAKNLRNNQTFVVTEPGGWFFTVIDNKLILDVGTGASIRNLNVFDIDKKEKVFDSQYYSTFEVEDNTIRYRTQITIDDKSKQPKCPQDGNGFVEEHILALATMQDTKTGKVECVYFE